MNHFICAAASVAIAAMLGGCGGLAPGSTGSAASTASTAPSASISPNANLVTQGIPPIPMRIAEQVAKYTDFRGHRFVDWHPTQREMLVSYLQAGASTPQLFRVASPMAAPEQLTDASEPVRRASYEPRDGRYIVFSRGTGGNEQDKLYRLDLPGKQVTVLTDTPERHSMEGWLHGSARLLTLSTPLDRTATGGSRETITQRLALLDPLQPQATVQLAELPGGGWAVGGVSWDDRRIALTRYLSANESQVWLLELASRKLTQLLPEAIATRAAGRPSAVAPRAATDADAPQASWIAGDFKRGNSGVFVLTNSASEFSELMFHSFADGRTTPVTRDIPWDVSGTSINQAGSLIAVQANVDGRDELRLYDGRDLKPLPAPNVPPGSVGATRFHPQRDELAFSLDSAQGPSQIWSMSPASGAAQQWTRAAAPAAIDTRSFSEQRLVRWPSFDGRIISGILNLPPTRFTGKRPVLIAIHGGPEGQAQFGFLGRSNYYVNELGIAVIQPNVRGSTGYGKTFLALDDGFKREDSVKDIGALLDWIATQPGLDAARVAITGGSYGGYMSLAVAATYPDRIASAIDVVGISNFLTFLQNTESYRRDLRRVEYGDEREPAMRAHLEKISPLTNAGKITKPLFVVQGKNDPRVPVTEAEQMVAKVRANGGRCGTCAPTTRATASSARRTPTSSSTRQCCSCSRRSGCGSRGAADCALRASSLRFHGLLQAARELRAVLDLCRRRLQRRADRFGTAAQTLR